GRNVMTEEKYSNYQSKRLKYETIFIRKSRGSREAAGGGMVGGVRCIEVRGGGLVAVALWNGRKR
ncbi:hypothetical protein, partial [Klebsiella pneumoniae]|uniref:hypothetical protein n=1 Tax=Klebsiella pneumoniae TaxID=573 RepID=UPI001C609A86